jgi:hypothetical protein
MNEVDSNAVYPNEHSFNFGCGNADITNPFFINATFKIIYGGNEPEVDKVLDAYFMFIRQKVKEIVQGNNSNTLYSN